MESLGEWRFSGVLLHQPFVKRAIPEKLVPQSELICRRLYRVFVVLRQRFTGPCLLSDIVAFSLTGFAVGLFARGGETSP